VPLIDEGSFEWLPGELLRRIPVDAPEWTDFNESDPGVTLVELFAFLTENLLWQIDERQRRRGRHRRLALLVVGAAGVGVVLWTRRRP